jgi:hypothetical protein
MVSCQEEATLWETNRKEQYSIIDYPADQTYIRD